MEINGEKIQAHVFFKDRNNPSCLVEFKDDIVNVYERSALLSTFTLFAAFAKGKLSETIKISDIDCFCVKTSKLLRNYEVDFILKDKTPYIFAFGANFVDEVSKIFSSYGAKKVEVEEYKEILKNACS